MARGDMLGQSATHSNNYREEFSDVDGDIGMERQGHVGLCMIITSVAVGMTGALVQGWCFNSGRESAWGDGLLMDKSAVETRLSFSQLGWECGSDLPRGC